MIPENFRIKQAKSNSFKINGPDSLMAQITINIKVEDKSNIQRGIFRKKLY